MQQACHVLMHFDRKEDSLFGFVRTGIKANYGGFNILLYCFPSSSIPRNAISTIPGYDRTTV